MGPGSKYLPSSTTYRPVTTTADSGPGSLRARIEESGNGDVVYFVAALNGQTIALTSGELAINSSISIEGPGPSLLTVASQSSTFRIFHVMPGHTVTIKGLTIRDGGGVNGAGQLRLRLRRRHQPRRLPLSRRLQVRLQLRQVRL